MCAPCKIIIDCGGAAESADALAGVFRAASEGLRAGLDHKNFSHEQIDEIMAYTDKVCDIGKELDAYRAEVQAKVRAIALAAQGKG